MRAIEAAVFDELCRLLDPGVVPFKPTKVLSFLRRLRSWLSDERRAEKEQRDHVRGTAGRRQDHDRHQDGLLLQAKGVCCFLVCSFCLTRGRGGPWAWCAPTPFARERTTS